MWWEGLTACLALLGTFLAWVLLRRKGAYSQCGATRPPATSSSVADLHVSVTAPEADIKHTVAGQWAGEEDQASQTLVASLMAGCCSRKQLHPALCQPLRPLLCNAARDVRPGLSDMNLLAHWTGTNCDLHPDAVLTSNSTHSPCVPFACDATRESAWYPIGPASAPFDTAAGQVWMTGPSSTDTLQPYARPLQAEDVQKIFAAAANKQRLYQAPKHTASTCSIQPDHSRTGSACHVNMHAGSVCSLPCDRARRPSALYTSQLTRMTCSGKAEHLARPANDVAHDLSSTLGRSLLLASTRRQASTTYPHLPTLAQASVAAVHGCVQVLSTLLVYPTVMSVSNADSVSVAAESFDYKGTISSPCSEALLARLREGCVSFLQSLGDDSTTQLSVSLHSVSSTEGHIQGSEADSSAPFNLSTSLPLLQLGVAGPADPMWVEPACLTAGKEQLLTVTLRTTSLLMTATVTPGSVGTSQQLGSETKLDGVLVRVVMVTGHGKLLLDECLRCDITETGPTIRVQLPEYLDPEEGTVRPLQADCVQLYILSCPTHQTTPLGSPQPTIPLSHLQTSHSVTQAAAQQQLPSGSLAHSWLDTPIADHHVVPPPVVPTRLLASATLLIAAPHVAAEIQQVVDCMLCEYAATVSNSGLAVQHDEVANSSETISSRDSASDSNADNSGHGGNGSSTVSGLGPRSNIQEATWRLHVQPFLADISFLLSTVTDVSSAAAQTLQEPATDPTAQQLEAWQQLADKLLQFCRDQQLPEAAQLIVQLQQQAGYVGAVLEANTRLGSADTEEKELDVHCVLDPTAGPVTATSGATAIPNARPPAEAENPAVTTMFAPAVTAAAALPPASPASVLSIPPMEHLPFDLSSPAPPSPAPSPHASSLSPVHQDGLYLPPPSPKRSPLLHRNETPTNGSGLYLAPPFPKCSPLLHRVVASTDGGHMTSDSFLHPPLSSGHVVQPSTPVRPTHTLRVLSSTSGSGSTPRRSPLRPALLRPAHSQAAFGSSSTEGLSTMSEKWPVSPCNMHAVLSCSQGTLSDLPFAADYSREFPAALMRHSMPNLSGQTYTVSPEWMDQAVVGLSLPPPSPSRVAALPLPSHVPSSPTPGYKHPEQHSNMCVDSTAETTPGMGAGQLQMGPRNTEQEARTLHDFSELPVAAACTATFLDAVSQVRQSAAASTSRSHLNSSAHTESSFGLQHLASLGDWGDTANSYSHTDVSFSLPSIAIPSRRLPHSTQRATGKPDFFLLSGSFCDGGPALADELCKDSTPTKQLPFGNHEQLYAGSTSKCGRMPHDVQQNIGLGSTSDNARNGSATPLLCVTPCDSEIIISLPLSHQVAPARLRQVQPLEETLSRVHCLLDPSPPPSPSLLLPGASPAGPTASPPQMDDSIAPVLQLLPVPQWPKIPLQLL